MENETLKAGGNETETIERLRRELRSFEGEENETIKNLRDELKSLRKLKEDVVEAAKNSDHALKNDNHS